MTASILRNTQLYRWSRFLRSLIFWQAVWFLYFQNVLSATAAILLYAVYDVAATLLEVPSGYMSDRLGRKKTLIASAIAGLGGSFLVAIGDSFAVFAAGQVLIGTSMAFASGTDEAMLYESLTATGRADEIEKQEIIAWRYSFSALTLSALTGGALTLIDPRLPIVGGALAFGGLFWITMRFVEPPRSSNTNEGSELLRLSGLGAIFKIPSCCGSSCLAS